MPIVQLKSIQQEIIQSKGGIKPPRKNVLCNDNDKIRCKESQDWKVAQYERA